MKKINNKSGDMNIYAVALVMAVLIIFAGTFEYFRVLETANQIKSKTQSTLDSFTMQTAREIYDSVKQGSVTANSINSDSFLLLLKNALSANGSGNSFANSYDGATRFALNNCQVAYSISSTLNIRCTYSLQIPTYLFGNQIFAPEIPVQLHSDYQIK